VEEMKGVRITLTANEIKGYQLLSDMAEIAYNEGLVSAEDDALVQKFQSKMLKAQERMSKEKQPIKKK
jgi:hypothetical protein